MRRFHSAVRHRRHLLNTRDTHTGTATSASTRSTIKCPSAVTTNTTTTWQSLVAQFRRQILRVIANRPGTCCDPVRRPECQAGTRRRWWRSAARLISRPRNSSLVSTLDAVLVPAMSVRAAKAKRIWRSCWRRTTFYKFVFRFLLHFL